MRDLADHSLDLMLTTLAACVPMHVPYGHVMYYEGSGQEVHGTGQE